MGPEKDSMDARSGSCVRRDRKLTLEHVVNASIPCLTSVEDTSNENILYHRRMSGVEAIEADGYVL